MLLVVTALGWSLCARANSCGMKLSVTMSPSKDCGNCKEQDVTGVVMTWAQLVLNGTGVSFLPASCEEIMESSPDSPSGYYILGNVLPTAE